MKSIFLLALFGLASCGHVQKRQVMFPVPQPIPIHVPSTPMFYVMRETNSLPVQEQARVDEQQVQVADRSSLDHTTPVVQTNVNNMNENPIVQEHQTTVNAQQEQTGMSVREGQVHDTSFLSTTTVPPTILPTSVVVPENYGQFRDGIHNFHQENIQSYGPGHLIDQQHISFLLPFTQNVAPFSLFPNTLLPPRPAFRQFFFPATTTTTTVAPMLHSRDGINNYGVKGGSVRSGTKGGFGTRSAFYQQAKGHQ